MGMPFSGISFDTFEGNHNSTDHWTLAWRVLRGRFYLEPLRSNKYPVASWFSPVRYCTILGSSTRFCFSLERLLTKDLGHIYSTSVHHLGDVG